MPSASERLRWMLLLCVVGAAGLACRGTPPSRDDPCSSDSDCVLDCRGERSCCGSSCPCATAVTTAEAARRKEERIRRCSDVKMECRPAARGGCDWDARFRAVCSSGTCMAEAIEGGAAPEHRAPTTPERYGPTDAECRQCDHARHGAATETCERYVEWTCGPEQRCGMTVPCDPACCGRHPLEEVGLDVAPWAEHTAQSSKPVPPPGLLVAVARGRGTTSNRTRLFFAEPASSGLVETDVDVPPFASVAWIHGTHDVVFTDQGVQRLSFPSRARVRLGDDRIRGSVGLDVSPAGDRLAIAQPGFIPDRYSSTEDGALEVLDLRTLEHALLAPAAGDSHPRWSPDGTRLVFQGRHEPGRLGTVEAASGTVDEASATQAFLRPVWHPSGDFLLAWLEHDDTCRLVLVTPDRRRFASTSLQHPTQPRHGNDIDVCGDLAVSPNGTHVAFWRPAGEEADELVMAALAWAGAQVVIGQAGHGGALDWTDGVRLEDLGLGGQR